MSNGWSGFEYTLALIGLGVILWAIYKALIAHYTWERFQHNYEFGRPL